MRILFVVQQIDYEPVGIMHLSSAAKAAGHEVELAVCARHDPLALARQFRPDVLGYWDYRIRKRNHIVWDMAWTTKDPGRALQHPDRPLEAERPVER